jgi:YesN/AraC family two-component response regulator
MELLYDKHQKDYCSNALHKSTILFDEITILLKGSLTYYINGNKIVLDKGDIIFIKNQSSREREKAKSPCDYISLNYTPKKEFSFPTHIKGGVDKEISALLSLYDEYKESDSDSENKKKLAFLDLLLITLQEKCSKKSTNPTVNVIIEYLKNNVYDNVSLNKVSEVTFYSPIYCSTLFKKETGKSIIDYFLDLKVSEAKKLLIEGETSLKNVSEKLAFSDYNYFSRTFKKRTGYTPFEYRKFFMK